jgi:hypothetical protein
MNYYQMKSKNSNDIKKSFLLLIQNNLISPFDNDKFFIKSLIQKIESVYYIKSNN